VSIVLDAGALIALERNDRELISLLKGELLERRPPITHAGVVGQVWRGGRGRQANLARFLQGARVEPLDDGLGRRAGLLLGTARTADVIDAALVLVASPGDEIHTSDVDDIVKLARAAGREVKVIAA
jgi:hypothetical protein